MATSIIGPPPHSPGILPRQKPPLRRLLTIAFLPTADRISRPVLRLTEAARAVAGGRLDQRVEAAGSAELGELAASFNRMAARLESSFAELEERVEDRTAELRRATEAAEAANRAKTDFLSTVSREVRTPLAAILGYADLSAEAEPTPDEKALCLRTIRDNGELLEHLVGDLLDINRIEAGKLQIEPTTCELAELLTQLESSFRPRAEEKELDFEIVAGARLPWRFVADPVRLRQVVSNLLANAIQYTERGRVTLTVESEPPGTDETMLVFRVADTGPGIPDADLKRLFRRFTCLRGDRPRHSSARASGWVSPSPASFAT